MDLNLSAKNEQGIQNVLIERQDELHAFITDTATENHPAAKALVCFFLSEYYNANDKGGE